MLTATRLLLTLGTEIGGVEEVQPVDEGETALQDILKERLGNDVNQFLDTVSAEGAEQSPQIGGDIAAANFIDRTLGMAKLFLSRDDQDVGRRLPALVKALRALQPDRSFDLTFETAKGSILGRRSLSPYVSLSAGASLPVDTG